MGATVVSPGAPATLFTSTDCHPVWPAPRGVREPVSPAHGPQPLGASPGVTPPLPWILLVPSLPPPDTHPPHVACRGAHTFVFMHVHEDTGTLVCLCTWPHLVLSGTRAHTLVHTHRPTLTHKRSCVPSVFILCQCIFPHTRVSAHVHITLAPARGCVCVQTYVPVRGQRRTPPLLPQPGGPGLRVQEACWPHPLQVA